MNDRQLPCIWWRDDDFSGYFSSFENLRRAASRLQLKPLLAAIPGKLPPDFRMVDQEFVFSAHGLHHINHSQVANKKSEFCASRPLPEVAQELAQSDRLCRAAFGMCYSGIFTPPFNNIHPKHLPALRATPFAMISTYAQGSDEDAFPGMPGLHIHCDVYDYAVKAVKHPADLLGEVMQVVHQHPENRTVGLMTHHKALKAHEWESFCRVVEALRQVGFPLFSFDGGYKERLSSLCLGETQAT